MRTSVRLRGATQDQKDSAGGPPPHRHDFEESFTVLEGEIEATFRGEKSIVHAGQTLSIPANAPHSFTNASGAAADSSMVKAISLIPVPPAHASVVEDAERPPVTSP